MKSHPIKVIALTTITLLSTTAAVFAQQSSSERQLSGTVVKEKEVTVRGGEISHHVVLLKNESNRYITVDLGPSGKTDITSGEDIQVVGRVVRIGDRPVVIARQVTADGQTTTIEQRGPTSQVRNRPYHTLQGEVINTKTVDLQGSDIKHRVVRLRTDKGNMAVVDLGPAGSVAELAIGDQIQATGRFVRVGDRLVLMARNYDIGGERTTQVARTESYPWTEGMKVKTINGIEYVSGGISNTEQQAIRAMQDDFSLKLVFAVREGNYLNEVAVTVENQAGEEVLDLITNGPILLADLEPGTYTVKATSGGDTNTKTIEVPQEGPRQVNFYWVGPRPA